MLPDPIKMPLMKADDLVGLIPGMGRSAIYEAVRRGDLPSIRVGTRIFIPTARLLARLDLATPEHPPHFSGATVTRDISVTVEGGTREHS